MLRRGTRGFTLIEMLVVITIILVLTAMLFPIIRSAVASANRTVCVSNLQMIAQMVEAYRQDYLVYPDMPNFVGLYGIPQGGVTGLALNNTGISDASFWCKYDNYLERKSITNVNTDGPAPVQDLTDSTYSYGYNYYGYVTDDQGLPFPVTSMEACAYFMGDPTKVDPGMPSNPGWDLGLVRAFTDPDDARTVGLFQGLANYRTPKNTIVTFCPNHPSIKPKIIPAAMITGEVQLIKPAAPNGDSDYPVDAASFPRRPPDPENHKNIKVPIDWRINKMPYTAKKTSSGSYVVTQDSQNFGDALKQDSAAMMPIVQVYYRHFRARTDDMPIDANDFAWYDTGIALQEHDMVMIVANAKWNYYPLANIKDRNFWTAMDQHYEVLFNKRGELYFTAAGNPIEAENPITIPADILMPDQPHCLLVGRVGDTTGWDENDPADRTANIFSLGSRGSYLVPSGKTGNLFLSLNDIQGAYGNNHGWCEVWVALYRPQ
ncbi:MAG: type II secretion system protein [Armatimonadota bacterium]